MLMHASWSGRRAHRDWSAQEARPRSTEAYVYRGGVTWVLTLTRRCAGWGAVSYSTRAARPALKHRAMRRGKGAFSGAGLLARSGTSCDICRRDEKEMTNYLPYLCRISCCLCRHCGGGTYAIYCALMSQKKALATLITHATTYMSQATASSLTCIVSFVIWTWSVTLTGHTVAASPSVLTALLSSLYVFLLSRSRGPPRS